MLTTPYLVKEFITTIWDLDEIKQTQLVKAVRYSYRNILGEPTYTMITYHPDVSYATVKCAQSSSCLAKVHYRVVKHCMCYLYTTQKEDLYYWHNSPHDDPPDMRALS